VALEEYIKRRKQHGILELVDQIAYNATYDYKAARRHPAHLAASPSAALMVPGKPKPRG